MKKLIILISAILISSCGREYKIVNTEIIKGKISAKEEGSTGRFATAPIIYIQDSKNTKSISIDYKSENYFKVGDSVLFILQQVEEIK